MEHEPGTKRNLADGLRRLLDQRDERRSEGASQNAALIHGKNRHVVGVVNLSASGAMIRFGGDLSEGDEVVLQLLDHGTVTGQVRWVRDGCVGIGFVSPIDGAQDQQ